MNRFEREFNRVLHEDMTAGGALGGSEGGFNPAADNITSGDSYAPDDSRIPKSIFGGTLTRAGVTKCKKCKKGKKCRACKKLKGVVSDNKGADTNG